MNTRTKIRSVINARRFWPIGLLIIALLSVTRTGAQEDPREARPGRTPVNAQTAAAPAPTPVSLRLAGAFQEGRNIYDLKQVSAQEIAAADQAAAAKRVEVNPGPRRVGLVRSVGREALSLKGIALLRNASPKGGAVWTLAIRSPGAFGLRIHFKNFDVGAGAALVYARVGDEVITRGPYTHRGPHQNGDFWTASLPGNTAFIEVSGADEPQLEVAEVLHFDKDLVGVTRPAERAQSELLPCQLDVMCYNSPPVNPFARDAVGQMNYVKEGNGYVCTGTILNDLDGDTFAPYFLTAYHCISTQAVTDTLEVVYQWQRSSCGGALPNYAPLPRSNGGALLVTNPTDSGNDMTFIRLNGDLPGGISLAGWTTGSLPASVTGIHHPDGDWKRVTFQHANLIVGPCDGLPTSQYHYLEQDSGVIEGGSSGSGIFNDQGQLMGQLYGRCYPTSITPGCSNRNQYNTVYGKFSVTYPLIQRWLEIGGTIYVDRTFTGVELGTPSQPFRTVTAAYNFAWNGARIKVKAGSYPETLTLSKQVTMLADGGAVNIGQ